MSMALVLSRQSRGRLAALTAALVVAAIGAAGTPATAAAPPLTSTGPLASTGWWTTDRQGRAVILHGVNIAAPWVFDATPLTFGFSQDDANFLAANGFNTVRLGLHWESAEPRPGVFNYDYIDEVRAVERMLAKASIYVVIDMHQDMWGPKYSGDGAPAWASIDDGLPLQPNLGFPGNYMAMPAQNRAWDNFWANRPAPDGVGLQDHYAAMWRAVASRFAGDPRVLGYDLMNEPWAGSQWAANVAADAEAPPVNFTNPQDAVLGAFYQRVADAIRSVDRHSMIWYEPYLPFDFGESTSLPGLKDPARPTGFTFHDYCLAGAGALGSPSSGDDPGCQSREDRVFEKVREHFDRYDPKSPPLLSEFGSSTNPAVIKYVADGADRSMVSWQYWMYCAACITETPPAQGATAADTPAIVLDMRKPLTGGNVDQRKLDVLVRPYPQLVAGTPESYAFDAATRVFTLRYSTARADGKGAFPAGSATELFVPRRQYPDGYSVSVNGATLKRDATRQKLYLLSSQGAKEVSLRIGPA